MRNVMFVVLLFCAATKLTAQTSYDEYWPFGYNCGLGFGVDTVYPITTDAQEFQSISSFFENGEGLYFSNDSLYSSALGNYGVHIPSYDNSYKASVLISKGDNRSYYLVTLDRGELDDILSCNYLLCLRLKVRDLEVLPNGQVVVKKVYQLDPSTLYEIRVNVVQHANGLDWWLITHEMPKGIVADTPTSKFVKFLLQKDTILGPFYQEIGTAHNTDELFFGDIAFSKSGKQIALSLTSTGIIDLFDFDRCTGQLSGHRSINGGASKRYGGIEFSENERFLYAVTGRGYDTNKLYQYDIEQSNITASEVLLWDEPNNTIYKSGPLKLAPNDRIYLASYVDDTTLNNAHRKLGVIHEPDSVGLACNFVPFDFELLPSCRVTYSLPNTPNYNLGATSIFLADAGVDTFLCISDTIAKGITIGTESVAGVTYEWLNVDTSNVNKYNSRAFVEVDSSTWFYLQLTDTTIQGSCQTRIDSVSVERRLCTGIEELHQAQVKVYPNPAKGILNIDLPHSGTKHTLSLYSLLGQTVLQIQLDKSGSIDVSTTPSGLYLYNISNEQGASKVGKLLIE